MIHEDVIILIPSYEPEENIIFLTKQLSEEGYPLLVINDGSSRNYDAIFDEVEKYAKVISYDKNKGKGYALKYGINHIRKNCPNVNYVITADGDGQHSIKDIGKVYHKLTETNELVFGVRHFDRDVPFRSRFGNSFSKFTRSLTTKEYIPDDQCGLRGFSRKYFRKLLKINGQKYDYEMNVLMLFQLRHYPINYLDIETIYLDQNKASHFAPFKDTARIQASIFSHSIISLVALLMMIASFIILFNFTPIHPLLNFVISELIGFQFLFALMTVIYPTYHTAYRLRKELFYFAIRLLIGFGIFSLFGYAFHFDFIASAIISYFLSETLNVSVSYLVTKHIYHTHN
ncbi:MAG: glycosyltransferase [Erysipelotrichaceae bacterium]|nr:glycosyltransferase [Erysipelotrichaceae bacterium]